MSTAKLTLRPPPNVEFVQGYPGIPPGAERPQAAVKGSIELRAGAQGIKAKWVRIELRKVETLPGGGQANTFFDFVGQSPVNVWQTSDEYALLHTQDFPFYIRIPESIPPSLALEKTAGVRYELVAQVCVKAKKGFFRRDKSTVLTSMAPIIIDKHELHSVWPLYQQPETRQQTQDGVTLVVERSSTCYGPGDRISVLATLRSDAPVPAILRGFEFALREATVFRPGGAGAVGKKAAPQVRVVIVGEQKVPVNANLFGGQQHRAELNCLIPATHTTTTLASARHIDITYTISVKALMGAGKPVQLELPVVISNWPRGVSIEAVRRIGPTPNLSLLGANGMPTSPGPNAGFNRTPQFNTIAAPGGGVSSALNNDVDNRFNTMPVPGAAASGMDSSAGVTSPMADEFGRVANPRRSTASANPNNRFTVHNFAEADMPPASPDSLMRRPSAGVPAPYQRPGGSVVASPPQSAAPNAQSNRWLSAEEEKRRLYESAKAGVDRVQSGGASSPPPTQPKTPPPVRSAWLTAEEEKLRLYNSARATAARTQEGAGSSHSRSNSISSHNGPASNSGHNDTSFSPGAALYHQAMAAVQRNASLNAAGGSRSGQQSGQPTQTFTPVRGQAPNYPTAEDEKSMLQRYHEAKAAVDRVQTDPYDNGNGGPLPYDALYPGSPAPGPAPLSPAPAAGGSSSFVPTNAYEEKMRMRQHFQDQDRAPAAPNFPQPEPYSPPPPAASNGWAQPPPAGASSYGMPSSAEAEKEQLRRRFEQDDAGAPGYGAGPTPTPPPRRAPSYTPSIGRSPPQPPMSPTGGTSSQPLTAAEEKARLRAQYAANDAPAAPPPLMPRPPPGYINESRQDDGSQQYQNGYQNGNHNGDSPGTFGAGNKPPLPPKPYDQ